MEYQSNSNRKSNSGSVSADRKATSRGPSQTADSTSRPPSPSNRETGSAPNPSAARADNRQTATQQIIAENVQFLIEQLEQGKSESLTAYLSAMANFHAYSFGNILQIAHFRPDATRVAGMYAWNQLGRSVKRGEKGIPIFAPMIGVSRKRNDEEKGESKERDKPTLIGFRRVYVWDRLSRDLRPAWPATVLRRRVRGVQACASMAAATSSLSSLARCKAVWIRTSSSSRAAICPAGSWFPFAAFRLR